MPGADFGILVPVVSPGFPVQSLKRPGAPLLTAAEVARLFGVCRATIYKLCAAGQLAHVRVSNAIRFERGAVEAFIAARSRK